MEEEVSFKELADFDDYGDSPEFSPLGVKVTDGWSPLLGKTQNEVFHDPSPYILVYGEKGSSKTIGCLSKLVRHCYENDRALALVITPTSYTGSEGCWHDLQDFELPRWRYGNYEWVNGEKGRQLDYGIGLRYTESKLHPKTKDSQIKIINRFETESIIVLKSIPYAEVVKQRMFGPTPSYVYIDEVTNCSSPVYFNYPAAQLGRRRNIEGPQQLVASCNPKGPSNWVYNKWFVEPVDEETGERDPDFPVYHLPLTENIWVGEKYKQKLAKIFRTDPVEWRRLVKGEWVERPDGEAIFANSFVHDVHTKGDALKNRGLMPIVGFPIIIGYDPGPKNFCMTLMQHIPLSSGKWVWLVFDELNYVGQGKPYPYIVPQLVRRLLYWNEKLATTFSHEHIADEAAFNTLNTKGSFDNKDIQEIANAYIKEHKHPIKPFVLKPCPKGRDTVPARVRLLQSLLMDETIIISATCTKIIDMFGQLRAKKPKEGDYDPEEGYRPTRTPHIHPFDSLSYPILYYHFRGLSGANSVGYVKPQIYSLGSR